MLDEYTASDDEVAKFVEAEKMRMAVLKETKVIELGQGDEMDPNIDNYNTRKYNQIYQSKGRQ